MRAILAAASAVLRHLAVGLILIGSVIACADLFVPADQRRGARPLTTEGPSTPDSPLTPEEERAWADLVARLASKA